MRTEFDAQKPRMDLLSFFVLLLLNAVVRDVASSWSLNAAIASLILFWVASNEWALENIRPRKPPPKPPDKICSRRIRLLTLVGLWMLFWPCNFWFEDDSTSSNRSVTSSRGRIVDIFERQVVECERSNESVSAWIGYFEKSFLAKRVRTWKRGSSWAFDRLNLPNRDEPANRSS